MSQPTHTEFFFITTAGTPAGSHAVAMAGDESAMELTAAALLSMRSGIPINQLVPSGQKDILGAKSQWGYLAPPTRQAAADSEWSLIGPISYTAYEDPADTAADLESARTAKTQGGFYTDRVLIWLDEPAQVTGWADDPEIFYDWQHEGR